MAKKLTFNCPKRRRPYRNFYEKKICFYLGKKKTHSFLDIDSIELGQRNGPIPHYNPVNIFFFNFQRTLKTNTLLFHIVFRFLYFFSMSTTFRSFVAGRHLLFYTFKFCFSSQLFVCLPDTIDVVNNVL